MNWPLVVECLRQELVEYGELLRLFEQQQECLFKREPESVLRLSGEIEDQVHILQGSRRHREQAVATYAASLGATASSTLRSLLPLIEADARPLVEALINEVNHLLHRVRRTSRQNHALLARTLELHQETLRQLRPDAFMKTYGTDGRVSLARTAATPALRAAG